LSGVTHVFHVFLSFIAVKFSDQPLGIQQTIIKEKIRNTAVRKEERNSHHALKSITHVKCNLFYYRVSLSPSISKETPICQQAFQNISIVAATTTDIIDLLTELGKLEGESYANRFIREHTSILIRKDEEDLIE
jgi:hypothetical protein